MNSMPFRQLKSFLKILIGVQYELRKSKIRPPPVKTGGGFFLKGIFIKSPSFSLTEQYFFAEKGSFFSGLYFVSIPPLFFRKKPEICGGKRHKLCLQKEKADFPRKTTIRREFKWAATITSLTFPRPSRPWSSSRCRPLPTLMVQLPIEL